MNFYSKNIVRQRTVSKMSQMHKCHAKWQREGMKIRGKNTSFFFFNLWTTNTEIFTRNNNSMYEVEAKVSSGKLSVLEAKVEEERS